MRPGSSSAGFRRPGSGRSPHVDGHLDPVCARTTLSRNNLREIAEVLDAEFSEEDALTLRPRFNSTPLRLKRFGSSVTEPIVVPAVWGYLRACSGRRRRTCGRDPATGTLRRLAAQPNRRSGRDVEVQDARSCSSSWRSSRSLADLPFKVRLVAFPFTTGTRCDPAFFSDVRRRAASATKAILS
jgi:hypothetical protein